MAQLLIFDNTPLSHFARAGQLTILEKLVYGYRCVVPAEVRQEVVAGMARFPDIASVLSAQWLEPVEVSGGREFMAFARYKAELGGGQEENNGEAAVLAWASIHGGAAVIDERAGTRLAQRDDIEVHGSLWLVVQGVRSGVLNRPDAEQLVNDLRETDMRLPIDGGALFAWAYQEGLLP